eukprot:CAMPEP_0194382380 /NCGR_PEP_ID=MMETSP0174-20130528/60157_1 /TAXON_ID=216777 /ORGANISM="Proboscia alata, Strain PI-D3" /LENGTH=299 /DNA_ID=CAMNT_0039167655 /DNA_START=34 /DNA_END=933 /DNA_ORIENTATION=+
MNDQSTKLRFLGLCGADDSVDPKLLGLICNAYPFVEFGILFRPDKEGQPRYASVDFVQRLSEVALRSAHKPSPSPAEENQIPPPVSLPQNLPTMRLAAHLCGCRVNEVLNGDDRFLSTLPSLGFQRVQINATAVNGVDTSKLSDCVPSFVLLTTKYSKLEFILQKNEETKPLWEGVLNYSVNARATTGGHCGGDGLPSLPPNVTMLLDESKGTGVLSKTYPAPPDEYDVGYAGGIGPSNIIDVLDAIRTSGKGRAVWIDMESRLRSTKDGRDVFDLDKCYECIDAVCKAKFFSHPSYLA